MPCFTRFEDELWLHRKQRMGNSPCMITVSSQPYFQNNTSSERGRGREKGNQSTGLQSRELNSQVKIYVVN